MKFLTLAIVLSLTASLALTGCDKKSASSTPAPKTNTVARVAEADWCGEHGVPEAECTKCHTNLIAGYKQKGDWCDKHNLPKSQCTDCDPSLKAKFEAMAPKEGK